MVLKGDKIKRAGIFFFYDQDGIVDDYIDVLLHSLSNNFEYLLAVINGKLSSEGRKTLKKYADDILVRKNEGFDGWAYKEGVEYIGWDKLSSYDELVFFNHTIMGPVNSFDDMFAEMNKRDLDFWGITKHYEIDFDPFGMCEYPFIPEHIQSYFIAIRKNMLNDCSFKKYWDEFPAIHNYSEAIVKHEAVFTKKFHDIGFKWDVYVNTDDIKDMNNYPLMFMTKELVENRKCPIFKRRMFFHNQDNILVNTIGNTAAEFFAYLENSKKYDTNLIWDNLLRTCHQSDILRCLNLRYTLSSQLSDESVTKRIIENRKIALVMHLYYDDLLDEMVTYASYMPEEADIYITTNTEKKKKNIYTVFSEKLKNKTIDVRVIENRGRDVSSVLVGVKDVIMDYDYVCFVHDKKTSQLKPGTVGNGFAVKCFDNILYNRHFVANVLSTFENNPRLGILSPPGPNHADFFGAIGNEWGPNYDIAREIAKKIGITVPMSPDKLPIAPYGTLFWFRPQALKCLYDYDWQYKDFPAEPNKNDGTLLHAIERLYPYAAQQEGYYPAIVMSDFHASLECNNLYFYVSEYANLADKFVGRNYHYMQLQMMENCLRQLDMLEDLKRQASLKYQIKIHIKRYLHMK